MNEIQHEDLVRAGAPELPDGLYYEATEVAMHLTPPEPGITVEIKERRKGLARKFLNDRSLSSVLRLKAELMSQLKENGGIHEDGSVDRQLVVSYLAGLATTAYNHRRDALASSQVSQHLTRGHHAA